MFQTYKDLPPLTITCQSTEDVMTGTWRTQRPVIDQEKCIKCYFCWKFCPDMSIEVANEDAFPEVDYDYCKGCGVCANECPEDAISMVREGKR